MARRRGSFIQEKLEELDQLERRYRGKPQGHRVQVLHLLAKEPGLSIEEAAGRVGYSKQSVKRWLKVYREEGIEGLVALRAASGRVEKGDDDLALLKRKLLAGEFRSMDEVMVWGRKRRGVGGETPEACVTAAAQGDVIPERVLKFLSSLPMSHSVHEWSAQFRPALQEFLGDVDRISLSVDVRCNLTRPKTDPYEIAISQSIVSGLKVIDSVSPDVESSIGQHIERILEALRKTNFPFSDFHEPLSREYYLFGRNYLAVAIFWRASEKPPISPRTVQMVDRLRPFLELLISDFIARHQIAHSYEARFDKRLEEVSAVLNLTVQERRTLISLLLGMSHDEIAGTLNITTNTVRYHLRSIYKKSGTHSQAELFAKYFTTRMDPK